MIPFPTSPPLWGLLLGHLVIGLAGAVVIASLGTKLKRHRDSLELLVAERTEDLRASEERSQLILNSAGDGIFEVNDGGHLTFVNSAALKMLGFSEAELMGRAIHPIIHHSRQDGSHYPEEQCPMRASFSTGTAHRVEDEVLWRKDGQPLQVGYSSTPLIKDGRVVGAVITFHDVSDRKRAQEAVLRAKEAAEAASKAKSLFIANMSHELRTPLNGIIVSVDLALGQDLSPKVEKIQKTISRSSRALLRTVNTILDFSKSEDGKLELAAIPFRLDEVLGKLSGTFVQKGAQKQIKISFDIAADEVPNALIGDPDRLVDVFNHLLDNAAKFSTNIPKAVIGVRDVGTSAKKTTLEFYVKDNGIGIASEDFEKIFDAFTQVDASSTRQYDGTGMGLAISKRLVERMGGTIRVESELGKGSTFYFTASFDRQSQEQPFKAPSFKDREDTPVNRMSSKTGGKMGSPEFLLELLSTIDPLIQKRKPKQCKEIMAEISRYAWPDEYAQEIVELDRLIGKYKFKDAYTILESIVKKLKSSIS